MSAAKNKYTPERLYRIGEFKFKNMSVSDLADYADENTKNLCKDITVGELVDIIGSIGFEDENANRQDVANFCYIGCKLRTMNYKSNADTALANHAAIIWEDTCRALQQTV